MSIEDRWYLVDGRPMHVLVGEPDPDRQSRRAWQKPIVMAHGLGVAAQSLRSLVSQMSSRGFGSFVPDQPGFGRSTVGEQPPPLDVPLLARSLRRWMDVAGIESAALFGNSVGAQIAADFAARFPGRTSALILVGPTTDPAARSVAAQAWRWVINLPRDPSAAGVGMFDAYRRAGLKRIARTAQYVMRDRIELKMPKVQAPTLLAAGSIDPIAPVSWVRDLCRRAPAGRLVVIEGAGHSMEGLSPGALADEMERFLSTLPTGGGISGDEDA